MRMIWLGMMGICGGISFSLTRRISNSCLTLCFISLGSVLGWVDVRRECMVMIFPGIILLLGLCDMWLCLVL